jgi:hypothetical protein
MITGTYSDHHFGIWRHSRVPVALSVRLSPQIGLAIPTDEL